MIDLLAVYYLMLLNQQRDSHDEESVTERQRDLIASIRHTLLSLTSPLRDREPRESAPLMRQHWR
jgi:hypothetical protein